MVAPPPSVAPDDRTDAPARPLRVPSLRTQLAQVFGALVVGVAVLLSLAFGEMLRQRIQSQASASLQVMAGNGAKLLADGLYSRSTMVQVIAGSSDLWQRGLESAEVRAMIARSQAINPDIAWLGVADTQGVVRTSGSGILEGASVKERPWFQEGLVKPHVGDVHPAKLLSKLLPASPTGEPLRFVDFAAPVRQNGQITGVFGIHGSWDWTRQTIESLLPPLAREQQIALFIFDRKGEIIYAPGGQTEGLRVQGQTIPLSSLQGPGGEDRHAASVVKWLDGRTYLTAAARVHARDVPSDLGWQVVARQPVDTAFADAASATRWSLVLGVAAALLAAGLAWLAAGRLSEDLNALADAASDVEAGKSDAAIPLSASSQETYRLSSSLIRMTRRLLSMNEQMEAQVQDRTHALQQANNELDRQARSDPLTGLLNRRGFGMQMQYLVPLAHRSHRPLSAITVDVDHFKRINDTFGHDAGDQVLKHLAQLLTHRLRKSDVVARLGGEEFVAVLPDTDLAGAITIAEQLILAIATDATPAICAITVSAGVSTLHDDETSATDLLRRADDALYAAKDAGRNRVCPLA